MELWIDRCTKTRGAVRLRLAGRLQREAVDLLQREVESLREEQSCPLELDLSRLTYLSGQGAILLSSLERQGVRLEGCPPLLAEILAESH